MNIKSVKSLFRDIYFTFIFIGLGSIFGYLVRVILARNLEISDYGLFYAVVGFFSFFAIFRSLGTSDSLVHFIPKYISEKNWFKIKFSVTLAFLVQLILGFMTSFLFFTFSQQIATYFFHAPGAAQLIRLHSITYFIIGFVDLMLGVFRGFQKPIISSMYDPIRLLFVIVSSLLFLKLGILTVKNTIVAWMLGYLVLAVIYAMVFYFRYKRIFRIKLRYFKSVTDDIKDYSIPLLFGVGAQILFSRTDVLVLTFFKGSIDVALYEVAFPASQLILIMASPILYVLFPMISKFFFEKNKNMIKEVLHAAYNAGLFLLAPMALLLMIYPELVIKILFSDKYLQTANAARIMTLGTFFLLFSYINMNILAGMGKIKARTKLMYIVAAFNIIGDIAFVPRFGYMGAISTTAASFFLLWLLSYKALSKELPGFHVKLSAIAKILLSLSVFVISVFLLKMFLDLNMYAEALIISAVSIAIYLAMGISLGVINTKLVKDIYRKVRE